MKNLNVIHVENQKIIVAVNDNLGLKNHLVALKNLLDIKIRHLVGLRPKERGLNFYLATAPYEIFRPKDILRVVYYLSEVA